MQRELLGAAAGLTGETLYREFKAAVPAMWTAINLRCQEAFAVITANAGKIPPGYSNDQAFDDDDEARQTSWRLIKSAANSIGTACAIRGRWRAHGFVASPLHDRGDDYGLTSNYAVIASVPGRLPATGQTSVQWLVAAARAGAQFRLMLGGEQDRAYLGGAPKQNPPDLSGGSLTYAD